MCRECLLARHNDNRGIKLGLTETRATKSLRSKCGVCVCVGVCDGVAGNVGVVLLPSLTFVSNTIDNRIIIMINTYAGIKCAQAKRKNMKQTNKKMSNKVATTKTTGARGPIAIYVRIFQRAEAE